MHAPSTSTVRSSLDFYRLQIHPDKSRLVDFRYRPQPPQHGGDSGLAASFNFLGFSHLWVHSRAGRLVVRQQMAKDRLARALKAISQQCRLMRHWPLRARSTSGCA
jgi:RNA-directed DNA polymerase